MDSSKKINVSIIGSTGYVGAELVKGFSAHPVFELKHLIGRSFAGQKFSDVYPEFRSVCDLVIEDLPHEEVGKDSDLVKDGELLKILGASFSQSAGDIKDIASQ